MTIRALYPEIQPTLNLDFAGSKTLDPRVTFTRSSIATVVNAQGLIETVPANVPRFDHDPITLECKGLLIEESRTNMLTYSQDFSTWSPSRATTTGGAAIAPDGTMTATRFQVSTAVGSSYMYKGAVSLYAGTVYTASIFLKAGEITAANLRDFTDTGSTKNLDLLTGELSGVESGPWSNTTVTPYGNGWYRLSALHTPLTTGAHNLAFANLVVDSDDGVSGYYLWGAQLETGSFPTSYIPTTTAAVTRANELASIEGKNFTDFYNPTEGTFVVDYRYGLKLAGIRVLGLKETSNTYLEIIAGAGTPPSISNGAYLYSLDNGTATVTTSGIPNVANERRVVAAGIKDNEFSTSNNGLSVSNDTNGRLIKPYVMNLASSAGGGQLCGHFLRLAYYPKRLPNAQLQALSA